MFIENNNERRRLWDLAKTIHHTIGNIFQNKYKMSHQVLDSELNLLVEYETDIQSQISQYRSELLKIKEKL